MDEIMEKRMTVSLLAHDNMKRDLAECRGTLFLYEESEI